MFDVGASELLLIVVVAVVVIGPKDLPMALRTAGRWIAKMRRVSGHFRSGIETMIREAELEEMEKTWREQNAAIMAAHPNVTGDLPPELAIEAASAEAGAAAAVIEQEPSSVSPQPPASRPHKRTKKPKSEQAGSTDNAV